MANWGVNHLTNTITMVELFAGQAAWLWWHQQPYPWEPLPEELTKGRMVGLYEILPTGREKKDQLLTMILFKVLSYGLVP